MDAHNQTLASVNTSVPGDVIRREVLPALYGVALVCGLLLQGVAAWTFLGVSSSSALVVYLKNMMVADLLMLATFPWRVAGEGGVRLRYIVCRYTAVLFYLSMYTGVAFASLVALERYYKVVRSRRVSALQRRGSTGHALALLTWALMIAVNLPNAVLTNRPLTTPFSCLAAKSPLGQTLHALSAHFNVGVFYAALLLMLFCYASIACHVSRSRRRVRRGRGGGVAGRSIFLLLGVFVLCFVPYHVCRVPYTLRQRSGGALLFRLKEAGLFLAALNVCLDPLVYFYMCKSFRQALLHKVSALLRDTRRPAGNELSTSNL